MSPFDSSRIRRYVAASCGLRCSVPGFGTGRYTSADVVHSSRKSASTLRIAPAICGSSGIAVLRVADREAQHVAERQRAVVAQHREPAAERAGHDRGERAGARHEREPELVAVALDRRRARRRPLRAEHDGLAAGRPEQRRQVAAGPVQVRLDDLEREARRDGGVERVAALLEHGHAGRRRKPVRRGDHAERAAELRARREHAAAYSGTNQTAPSGGSVTSAENGWSCQGIASASTPPRLPTPEPP